MDVLSLLIGGGLFAGAASIINAVTGGFKALPEARTSRAKARMADREERYQEEDRLRVLLRQRDEDFERARAAFDSRLTEADLRVERANQEADAAERVADLLREQLREHNLVPAA